MTETETETASAPETAPETETPETLLAKINEHCQEIGRIHDDYRDASTYGCAGKADEILVLVKRLRALLGPPA